MYSYEPVLVRCLGGLPASFALLGLAHVVTSLSREHQAHRFQQPGRLRSHHHLRRNVFVLHGLYRIPTTLASGVASSNGATEDLESESKEERDRLVFALRALSKDGIESELCSSLPLLLVSVDGGEADDELDIEVSVPLLLTSSSLRSTFTLRRCKSLVLYALGVDTHRGSDTELDLW